MAAEVSKQVQIKVAVAKWESGQIIVFGEWSLHSLQVSPLLADRSDVLPSFGDV